VARATVLTCAAAEGPGALATWLPAAGLELDVLSLWAGGRVPERVDSDALVVLGGPQQAYDDRSAPWLRATKDLLRRAVADGLPVLAICLGAQLLAEATGGRVAPGPDGPELGARLVAKRDAAGNDPLCWDLPLSPVVVQWHWDGVVDLPPGAVLLASSPRFPHQAFRLGERAWGLQFHVEAPAEMVRGWAAEDEALVRAAGLDPDLLVARTLLELPEVEQVWRAVMERFAALAGGSGAPGPDGQGPDGQGPDGQGPDGQGPDGR